MSLPSYVGIIINHYKDPYWPSSIMESRRVFFVAHMVSKWVDECLFGYRNSLKWFLNGGICQRYDGWVPCCHAYGHPHWKCFWTFQCSLKLNDFEFQNPSWESHKCFCYYGKAIVLETCLIYGLFMYGMVLYCMVLMNCMYFWSVKIFMSISFYFKI